MKEKFLKILRNKLDEEHYDFWIKTSVFKLVKNQIIITSPNIYLSVNLKERYRDFFIEVYKEITGKSQKVECIFLVSEENGSEYLLIKSNCRLNNKYTFENFIVKDNNIEAYNAALETAKSPGKTHNPLYIYGNVGVGKTHLSQGIGHYIIRNYKDLKVSYFTSEEFTNNFIFALKEKRYTPFKNKMRNIDVFILESLQFHISREQTQVELFSLFHYLHNLGKQIIIDGDRPIEEIELIEDLKNLMQNAYQVKIKPPGYELRFAILNQFNQQRGTQLPEDVIIYISENIKNNIRELEGAFKMLCANKEVFDEEITLEKTKEILKDWL